jgi:hypothetical protein
MSTRIDAGVKVTSSLFRATEKRWPDTVQKNTSAAGPGGHHPLWIWMKGVDINATVDVNEFTAKQGCTYEVGFVQILEFSRMKAIYGEKLVKEWKQPVQPCYDSTHDDVIPWYNNGNPDGTASHKPITGTGQISLKMTDYPTSIINPYINNTKPLPAPVHLPLTYYIKQNEFNVYLMVRRTETASAATKDVYLQHVYWETMVVLEPGANVIGTNAMYKNDGYSTRRRVFNQSWTYGVITKRYTALPPVAAGSANDHIDNNRAPRKRRPVPFVLRWQ